MIEFLPIPKAYHIFGLRVSIYLTVAFFALMTFWFLFVRETKKRGIEKHAGLIALHFGFWTFLGFHVYRILFVIKKPELFLNPTSGIDSFGVVFGLIAVLVYAYYNKIKFGVLFDSLAIPSIAAATVQRFSDTLIQDKIGVIADLPWSVYTFYELRHPIGLYYFLVSLVILGVLFYVSKSVQKSGNLFLQAGLFYCFTRFFLDFFRANPPHDYFGLSVHQIAYGSLFFLLLVIYAYQNSFLRYVKYRLFNRSAFLVSLLIGGKKGRWFYKSYQYFRWLDDIIDESKLTEHQKKDVLNQQKKLAEQVFKDIYSINYDSLCYEERCLYDVVLPYYTDSQLVKRKKALENNYYLLFNTFYYDLSRKNKPIIESEYIPYSKAIGESYAFAFFESYDISAYETKYNPYLKKTYGVTLREAVYEYAHLCHMIHTLRDFDCDWKEGYHNLPKNTARKIYFKKIRKYITPTFDSYSAVINNIKPWPLKMIAVHFHHRFKKALDAVK